MDTSSYNYPQLFDIQADDTTQFDTDLFHGLNLSDNVNNLPAKHNMYNNNNNLIDKKLSNSATTEEDMYNSLAAAAAVASTANNSYLQYLQSNNNNNSDFFYDTITATAQQQQMMLMNIPQTMDLIDYDYFNGAFQQLSDQKQQYNWLYDPIDTFLPTSAHPHQQQQHLFCDDSFVNQMMNQQQLDSIMSDNMDESITVEGGMSRGYVSLSDVNSFVAKADSMKQSCLLQMPNELMADFTCSQQQPHQHQHFSSSESTNNEDSEDDYSDSETELRWPMLNTSYSTPTTITNDTTTNNKQQKLVIKIKKPSSSSNINSNALPSPYGEHHQWGDLISPKTSKSANTSSSVYKSKYRKSMSNIFNSTTTTNKKKNKLLDNSKRRGSTPHRLNISHSNHSTSSLGSLHSSSSLSSLSNTLQKSMRVSDSINSFLSAIKHSSDEEDAAEEDDDDIEEDEDDDEYQIRSANASGSSGSNQIVTKKGRNVDKACNHCKRSHLRCDDMRPCRRCVATGKTGCKDVQHKPRGRPKLHKK